MIVCGNLCNTFNNERPFISLYWIYNFALYLHINYLLVPNLKKSIFPSALKTQVCLKYQGGYWAARASMYSIIICTYYACENKTSQYIK